MCRAALTARGATLSGLSAADPFSSAVAAGAFLLLFPRPLATVVALAALAVLAGAGADLGAARARRLRGTDARGGEGEACDRNRCGGNRT